jgi:hypothetical protein
MLTGGGGTYARASISASNTLYIGAVINFPGWYDYNNHFSVTDASYNALCSVEFVSGTTSLFLNNTGGTGVSSSSIAPGTWYVQLMAVQGSGSNATCSLSYSSTGSAGSWTTITSTNGTWTATPGGVQFSGQNTGNFIIDDVRAYTSQMNWN